MDAGITSRVTTRNNSNIFIYSEVTFATQIKVVVNLCNFITTFSTFMRIMLMVVVSPKLVVRML